MNNEKRLRLRLYGIAMILVKVKIGVIGTQGALKIKDKR